MRSTKPSDLIRITYWPTTGSGSALQRTGKGEEARQMLQRYRELKAQEDRTIGERVAVTTRFIVDLKEDGRRR